VPDAEKADEKAAHADPSTEDRRPDGSSEEPAAAAPTDDEKQERPRVTRDKGKKSTGQKVKRGSDALRSRLASLVWVVAVVCALFLAVGALLIALGANQDNAIVKFVLDVADVLDLNVFGRDTGIFTFDGKDAATKGALVNWGIAAVAYLVVGKILDRIIRP
jgi:hypothetical protein